MHAKTQARSEVSCRQVAGLTVSRKVLPSYHFCVRSPSPAIGERSSSDVLEPIAFLDVPCMPKHRPEARPHVVKLLASQLAGKSFPPIISACGERRRQLSSGVRA